MSAGGGPFEALVSLVKAREACPPQVCLEQLLLDNVRRAQLPEALFHWGHPAAMLLLTLPLALGGAYLGWQIKLGNEGADPQGVKRARALHPPLMIAAGVLLVFGVQSGIASLLMQGQPLLDSAHAKTAGALLALYAAQGFLGTSMGGNGAARLAHTAAGTALVAWLLGHTALGLTLGFQLP
ncbi:hypothetical protein JKP88DRAFT_275609 [Tribonema minus]|uniref:Uncharacterized protein n=1 Tax=Tribonema minus TaxID=303371 RepID=A0A835ZEW1_9STRA|nr:hypothetical protein JKP88DRAFT_275609 [Tribonema minus]